MRFRAVEKRYGERTVADGFTLDVGAGTVCLFGPSGCGKTTLLRIAAGLERPDGGAVEGAGRVSMVFQEDRLVPHLSSLDNIVLCGADKKAALDMLDRVGLAADAGRPAGELSGGMRRRAALARALCRGFDTLLLDEPFSGVDEQNRESLYGLIRSAGRGKTVLLVSHDRRDAAALAERIVFLQGPPLYIARDVPRRAGWEDGLFDGAGDAPEDEG